MEGIPQVKHVATGRWHTCAIVDTGNVLCWGRNFGGTLGNGTGKDELFVPPGRVIDVSDAVEISAASDFGTGGTSCARVSNNRVYCWGILARTPLGMPRRFDALGLATQVAAEIWTACAVQFDRSLKCSGMIVGSPFATKRYYPDGKLPHLPETVKIVVGSCHACLISAAERVHCWGGMEYEKLEQRDKPDKEILQLLPPPGPVPQLENIVDIAIGSHDETCAVRRDGVLLCWERADPEGKGGHPSKPHPIPELSGVIQVTLGANHSCALTGVGQVFCWGDNQQAQLGTGNIQPAKGPLAVHID
jgi:alpha-tubulin suppressor-like RCC1 family protein